MINHEAIYISHPSVVSIVDIGEDLLLKDASNSDVTFDQSAYDSGLIQLEEQAEAKETLRQSLITKLATTLTPEETALLEELL